MRYSFRFSNLLGAPYRRGNLVFTPDGDSLIAPISNCLSIFELKRNRSQALPCQARHNITAIGLSPNGLIVLAATDQNDLLLVSLVSRTILRSYRLNGPVGVIEFSPDGKYVAVGKGSQLIIYAAPGCKKEVNPFQSVYTFSHAYDELTCIKWADNSQALIAGGRDGNARVLAMYWKKVTKKIGWKIFSLGGSSDAVVGAFFFSGSFDATMVTANGQLSIWECDADPDEILGKDPIDDAAEFDETADNDAENEQDANVRLGYHRLAKHSYKVVRGGDAVAYSNLTATAFHPKTRLLCSGFADGQFFIHELPDFSLIHSLKLADVSSLVFNPTGEWLGIASGSAGQLAVWEWRSEIFVVKQQFHFNAVTALSVSPSGRHAASGGDDAKVKLWDLLAGNCYATFSEHSGGISGVAWTQSGKAIVSSSLDGTVRAFDTQRYRNFRTFATPVPLQLTCVSVDESGELLAAGSDDEFKVFVWAFATGQLLETVSGHSGPISSISFVPNSGVLLSASWDKSVRLTAVTEKSAGGQRETLTFQTDCLCVAVRPDGRRFAVATLDAQIAIFDTDSSDQLGSIEGRRDIGYVRHFDDKITAKKRSEQGGQSFTTISYTPDGEALLAAGLSKYICLYSVIDDEEYLLMKRFEVTKNLSLDASHELLDRRKMTEFGSTALIDTESELKLPGSRRGIDSSRRTFTPEVRVFSVNANPTGDGFLAATTEGLLAYSLSPDASFDPTELEENVTPESVLDKLKCHNFSGALMSALRLGESGLINKACDSIPLDQIEIVVSDIPSNLLPSFVIAVAKQIQSGSPNIEFYFMLAERLLMTRPALVTTASSDARLLPALTMLQGAVSDKMRVLGRLADFAKYTLKLFADSKAKAVAAASADVVMQDG